jgi:beta-1,4-mannosyltransferase
VPGAATERPSDVIRVLSSPGVPDDSINQTVKLLIESLPDHVEVRKFSWVRAFLSHYDVLHIHWPEYLMRHKKGAKSRAKRALFALLIARTAVLRTPTVWTVHNVRPHEPGPPVERFLLDQWSRRATRRVYMYESALPSPAEVRDVCIPRGDYEPVFGPIRERSRTAPDSAGRLLLFGLLRPYKGIERLIDAVRSAGDDGMELLVTGGALDEAYARQLQQANDAKNVTVQIEVLSDERLAEVILRSTLVVLPYRNMYNSGAALLSLTLRRPILVPASPTMRELRKEVGEGWVFLYEGELTTEDLREALRLAAVAPADGPDLTGRDWARVGEAYAAVYGSIARRGRAPRRRPAVIR